MRHSLRAPLLAAFTAALAAALTTPPSTAQHAEQLMARLTVREKAGQLFMAWSLSRADAKQQKALLDKIDAAGLGGVILSLGTCKEAVDLITAAQKGRAVPLLCAGDFEAGVGFRLDDATDFGNNMLIGASGLERLSEAAGRATGLEAKALGFQWCFAPVADVNVNAANPIINVRSFGEDPAQVGRFTAAFVRGVEGAGVLATAKHFPGHGDVDSDSHLTMPTVPGSRERLEQIELPPFRAAITAGVSSIMTGHLAVPGLGEDPAVPATLSEMILTDLLRKSFGFQGLIVTDALDMGGVREKIAPEDAAVRALAAGADMLLMPPDPVKARDAVIKAVDDGRVTPERLHEAVLRVLKQKERTGLLAGRGLPARDWQRTVNSDAHLELAIEIATRGVTLVRDRDGLVPLPATKRGVLVVLEDQDDGRGVNLGEALGRHGFETLRLHPKSDAKAIGTAVEALRSAELAVVAFAIKVRSYLGKIGVPEPFRPVVDALRAQPRAVAVSLGNPYLIRDFGTVSTYVCAFAGTRAVEECVARALLGQAPVTGRMPVRIPEVSERGAGLSFYPQSPSAQVQPSVEGLPDDLAARVRALCERAIADGAFPGASVCITRRGQVLAEVAVGRETYDKEAKLITPDTRYDLASLTKVCATTPATLRLLAAGKLDLDQKISALVPAFSGGDKDQVTVRHLLTHSAGLPGYVKFFETLKGKDAIVAAAAAVALEQPPGKAFKYSDIGMILLGACIERAAGASLERVVAREVTEPLGMRSATYVKSGNPIDAPATEDDGFRGRVVRGEVHDENAFAMGGVSGHAGLFATARDVALLGNAFLGGGRGWLPAPLARDAVRRQDLVAGSTRALGWDTFKSGGSGGTRLSPAAFGHTGFTGTSLWCDPATDLCIVLLSNRVHPTRKNDKIEAVRRELADLVATLVVGS